MGSNTGGYSRFQVTGMIKWRQKSKPQKIPGPKIPPTREKNPMPNYQVIRISRKGYTTGFIKQMQCNVLNIKTTT